MYVVVARLGLQMDAVSGFATLVWPPTGIALAALLLFGNRLWPGIALGATVVNAWTGAPALAALAMGAGNALEALVGATLLRRIAGFRLPLERQRDVLGLVFFAAVGSTAVSATIGVASLLAAGIAAPAQAAGTWGAWWLGDMIGDLVVAPVFLAVSSAAGRVSWRALVGRPSRRALVEAALVTATIVVSTGIVFGEWLGPGLRPLRMPYVLWPALIWAALRFGTAGAARATFLTTALAIAGTAMGGGPFVRGTLAASLTSLQVFAAVTAATFLVLGAVATERRRAAEEQERLIRELESAVDMRDDFLSVAAHELKTPLTPARLLAQGLLRAAARGDREILDPGQLAPRLEAIERAVGRLESLIDQLLDVTRLAAGRLVLGREEMDLVASVRDVVARLDGDVSRRGGQVSIEAPDSVTGWWDRVRIEQVVANLVGNALKYGAGEPVEIAIRADESTARLSVKDHGIGISSPEQGRIFEKFARVVPVRHYGGFGLGLWIVREIVVAHGGTVSVESDAGEGSLFLVELPRAVLLAPGERMR